jgi:hypothetical protein
VSNPSSYGLSGTDLGTTGSNRSFVDRVAQITAELGCCWDDDCEAIADAYLAQSNCDPGQALRYGKILRDLGNVLRSSECGELQAKLSIRWPEADYILCKRAV